MVAWSINQLVDQLHCGTKGWFYFFTVNPPLGLNASFLIFQLTDQKWLEERLRMRRNLAGRCQLTVNLLDGWLITRLIGALIVRLIWFATGVFPATATYPFLSLQPISFKSAVKTTRRNTRTTKWTLQISQKNARKSGRLVEKETVFKISTVYRWTCCHLSLVYSMSFWDRPTAIAWVAHLHCVPLLHRAWATRRRCVSTT